MTGIPVSIASMPSGFPVPDGLTRVEAGADDPRLAARWTSARGGAEIYDELLISLPAAGYRISDLFPGGAAAVIRFEVSEAERWEVSLFGTDPLTVELRLVGD